MDEVDAGNKGSKSNFLSRRKKEKIEFEKKRVLRKIFGP